MFEKLLLIFELIGTVAFAASGAMAALSQKMDVFGVLNLGVITSVGGGVMRDIILGNTPPATFQNPVYSAFAIITSAVVFIPEVRHFLLMKHKVYDKILLLMDSVGLGIFTADGVETAYLMGHRNPFLLVFVGTITGIGGGVLRDILAGRTPYIFTKHFYASASVIGAVCCIVFLEFFGAFAAVCGGGAVVTVLRLLAAKFRWDLPKADK